MNKKAITIGIILVAVILAVAIGYAAITSKDLNITGGAQANPNDANFTVRFEGEPEVSDASKVTAKISEQNELSATMNVKGLTAKGDTETATFTIKNASEDLAALISTATPTNDNTEFFKVTQSMTTDTTVEAGQTTTLTVTVELIKTPITQDETATIGVAITANPQQPAGK